jgi:hypothetical protein
MSDLREIYVLLMERYQVPPDLIKNCIKNCDTNNWFREIYGDPVLTENIDGVDVDWWIVTPEQNEHFHNIMQLNKIVRRSGS